MGLLDAARSESSRAARGPGRSREPGRAAGTSRGGHGGGVGRGRRVILEGIVTTLNRDGVLNIAPMGPQVDADSSMARFILRPYRTATTYVNLKARGEGVLHVTDDVL